MDILSKQYETVEEFLTDNKHYVDKLKEINNYASNKAKENKTIRRGRPSHTEYMKEFAMLKMEKMNKELFVVECKMLNITYKKNYLD